MDRFEKSKAAFLVWWWGDQEIESPTLLKTQLEAIQSKGFSGVLAVLNDTRYELIDRKVVRAAVQVSQWAKKRGVVFWFQSDPRRASRTLILQTGERTQVLIVSKSPEDPYTRNIAPINQNKFMLRYDYPKIRFSPIIQELSVYYEPYRLERCFLFKMNNGIVLKDTIRDITAESRFFGNVAEHYIEVFGDVRVPENEEWWVAAFPCLDTNLYDFAGRQSNDKLHHFIEDLFDSGAYLDGVTWDDIGLCRDSGQLPVSLSLYNSFQAEYGYDLRKNLLALILDLDDRSHVPIRCNYYSILMDLAYGAYKDFYGILHGFFGDLETVIPRHDFQPGHLIHETFDPCRSLEVVTASLGTAGENGLSEERFPSLLSNLAITRSIGVFSKTQEAFASLKEFCTDEDEMSFWINLLGLFSIRWMAQGYGRYRTFKNKSISKNGFPHHPMWAGIQTWIERLERVGEITDFRFPEADTAFVFPSETLMTKSPEDAEEKILIVIRLIARLIEQGIQMDVISPMLLKKGRFTPDGVFIHHRAYNSIIYPFPEVLDPDVLELISVMDKFNFPILLGGAKPAVLTSGKLIPHQFTESFDPESKDLTPILNRGVRPLFEFPDNSLGTLIKTANDILFLLSPKKPGGTLKGQVRYKETEFTIRASKNLIIHRMSKNGQVVRVL